MKIEIHCKHWGLADLLRNVLEKDHEVVFDPSDKTLPERYGFKYGLGDIHLSTFPHYDLHDFKRDKPIILYATDPIPLNAFDDVISIQKWNQCTTIVAEDCFPRNYFPFIADWYIPYAIDTSKYKMWTGGINKVAIINRKARERWNEVIGGSIGLHYSLEDFMGDIPFEILSLVENPVFYDDNLYRELISKYNAFFYFSNSPYTIVMFELMSIKAPIVAFNHTQLTTYKPVEKYIENRTITIEDTRKKLKQLLSNPKKVDYPIIPFDTIKNKWNNVIQLAYDKILAR